MDVNPLLGLANPGQEVVDAALEGGDLRAVFGDVREVGLGPRADLVNGLHFGLDGADQVLAAGDDLEALVEIVGDLLDLDETRFDSRQLLLAERELGPPLFELLEHRFGARQLVFRRLDLPRRVALAALHPIQLGEQFVLHLG